MFCSKCGAQVTELTKFCSSCGAPTTQAQGSTLSAAAPPPPDVGPEQTSGKAIASLVCGIINIFPLSVVAIILGHISLSEIGKSAGRLKGRGLAIAGLVLGYLGVVAIPFILILAVIAIPNLLRAKIAANEASAMGSMRNLLTAEVVYQTNNPKAGYTCNLSDLTGLDSNLAAGQKHGYAFAIQNCRPDQPDGPVTSFQLIATPVARNTTGMRAFCMDESGVLRFDRRGSAEDCVQAGDKMD